MNIGLIPGWLIAAALAILIGGYPVDIILAGAAIMIGLSLFALTRNPNALIVSASPGLLLGTRYLLLPLVVELDPARADTAVLESAIHFMTSPGLLIAFSVLAIITAGVLGLKWAHHGTQP